MIKCDLALWHLTSPESSCEFDQCKYLKENVISSGYNDLLICKTIHINQNVLLI